MSVCCAFCWAQQDTAALAGEHMKVAELLDSCFRSGSDSAKLALSKQAADRMEPLLKNSAAFGYNFYRLGSVSSVYAPSGKVRVMTFGVALSDGTYSYHGFVLCKIDGSTVVTRLRQASDKPKNPLREDMQAGNWYGAIYYDISQFGSKKSPVYALCGWDGNDMFTNRKVLEQFTVSPAGVPRFGGSFDTEYGNGCKRVVFEFSEKAVMTLRYDKSVKGIVADHLATPPEYRGNTMFAGPDWTYDAYYFKDNKWNVALDIDVKLDK